MLNCLEWKNLIPSNIVSYLSEDTIYVCVWYKLKKATIIPLNIRSLIWVLVVLNEITVRNLIFKLKRSITIVSNTTKLLYT